MLLICLLLIVGVNANHNYNYLFYSRESNNMLPEYMGNFKTKDVSEVIFA